MVTRGRESFQYIDLFLVRHMLYGSEYVFRCEQVIYTKNNYNAL